MSAGDCCSRQEFWDDFEDSVLKRNFQTLITEEEDGELFLELPDELMDQMGWEIGDELIFDTTEQGGITISKQKNE